MAEPLMSSSPLKTATAVSASVSSSFAGEMNAYIGKYCEVVTGGRVVFQGYHGFAQSATGNGWYRFKCTTCQDNWNMKTDLFVGNSAPKELTDWLDQHKHICQSFRPSGFAEGNPKCGRCGWVWTHHKVAQPVFDIETGQWAVPSPPTPAPVKFDPGTIASVHTGEVMLGGMKAVRVRARECAICHQEINAASGVGICDVCYRAARSAHETKAIVSGAGNVGRMFRRDIRRNKQCESNATDKATSPDSSN